MCRLRNIKSYSVQFNHFPPSLIKYIFKIYETQNLGCRKIFAINTTRTLFFIINIIKIHTEFLINFLFHIIHI